MKQYERWYLEDPMYLMGVANGLLKALMVAEKSMTEDEKEEIYERIEEAKSAARRASALLSGEAVSAEEGAE